MPKQAQKYAERLPIAEAKKLFGDAAVRAVARDGLDNWIARGVPSHGLVKLLRYRETLTAKSGKSTKAAQLEFHQNAEWREIRSYTACVEALKKLAQADQWSTIRSLVPLLSELSGFGDEDWRRIYEGGMDHLVAGTKEAVAIEDRRWNEWLARLGKGTNR